MVILCPGDALKYPYSSLPVAQNQGCPSDPRNLLNSLWLQPLEISKWLSSIFGVSSNRIISGFVVFALLCLQLDCTLLAGHCFKGCLVHFQTHRTHECVSEDWHKIDLFLRLPSFQPTVLHPQILVCKAAEKEAALWSVKPETAMKFAVSLGQSCCWYWVTTICGDFQPNFMIHILKMGWGFYRETNSSVNLASQLLGSSVVSSC